MAHPPATAQKGWAILALVTLVAIAYANSLNVPFYFDDQKQVLQNEAIRELEPLTNYLTSVRGLIRLSFALNYRFGGLDPRGYHVVNVSIHALNAVLVFLLAIRVLGEVRHAVALAFLIAGVFAAHPLQTSAVTYVTQRTEAMATTFYLTTLLLYARARAAKGWPRAVLSVAAVIASALGVLTKEVAATVPAAVVLYDLCFRTDGVSGAACHGAQRRFGLDRFVLYVALFATAMIPLAFHWQSPLSVIRPPASAPVEPGTVALSPPPSFADPLPRVMIPSAGFALDIEPSRYLATQMQVIVWYLRLFVLPTRLTFDYGWPIVEGWWRADVLLPAALLAALAAAGVAAYGRWPLATFAVGWFFLLLAPSSSVIPILDAAFEYRMYLPVAALALLVIAGVYGWIERRPSAPRRAHLLRIGFALGCVWIMSLAALTIARNRVHQDPLVLATDSARKAPHNWRPWYDRGNFLMQRGDLPAAREAFETALAQNPRSGPVRIHLAIVLYRLGDVEGALRQLERVVALGEERSVVATARGLIGKIQRERENWAEAARNFEETVRLQPEWWQTREELAVTYYMLGRWADVVRELETIIDAHPEEAARLRPGIEDARRRLTTR